MFDPNSIAHNLIHDLATVHATPDFANAVYVAEDSDYPAMAGMDLKNDISVNIFDRVDGGIYAEVSVRGATVAHRIFPTTTSFHKDLEAYFVMRTTIVDILDDARRFATLLGAA